MSFDFEDESLLPPATGGMATFDIPASPVKTTEEQSQEVFSDGTDIFNDSGLPNAVVEAETITSNPNASVDPSEWVGAFDEDEPPPPEEVIPPPKVEPIVHLNTPITGFNQQQLRLAKAIEGIGKDTNLTAVIAKVRDDLTQKSMINLFVQGQADNSNLYRSYYADEYINKYNPAYRRFEKDRGHVPFVQLHVSVKLLMGEQSISLRDFHTNQEGFEYWYPDLYKWVLKRKDIIEQLEVDTTNGKETVPVIERLGEPEKFIDINGNELSIVARRDLAYAQDNGIERKRVFTMPLQDFIKTTLLKAEHMFKNFKVSEALKDDHPLGFDPTPLNIDVKMNPDNDYIYHQYRVAEWFPTLGELVAISNKDEKAVLEITYEPKLPDEVSRFEHLIRALSTEKLFNFKQIDIKGVKPLVEKDVHADTQAKLKITTNEGVVKEEVNVTYKRALPVTGPYRDIIQNSIEKTDLTALGLQKPSINVNDPQHEVLKKALKGKTRLVLPKSVTGNYQHVRKPYRTFSYSGIPAYPEIMTNMNKDVLPFVLKDLVPGHYTVEDTMEEIKTNKEITIKAVPSSPLYQGTVKSKVKVFTPVEHMLNSVITGFANTDAVFKDNVNTLMADNAWEKRFDLGRIGTNAYGFSPYSTVERGWVGQKVSEYTQVVEDIPLNYHYLRRFHEFFNYPGINDSLGHDLSKSMGEEISHYGAHRSSNSVQASWGVQHSKLLNYAPFYYRKRKDDNLGKALFSNLVKEKRLTADWTFETTSTRTVTGVVDPNEPGIKYKGDIVVDAMHPSFLVTGQHELMTMPLTRQQHPNGKIYHHLNIDSKYPQKDIRFTNQSALAFTLGGRALYESRIKSALPKDDKYPHFFDKNVSDRRVMNLRYDWIFSDVYLKSYSLKSVSDYLSTASSGFKRYRQQFNQLPSFTEDETETGVNTNNFLAQMANWFKADLHGHLPENRSILVNKVFDKRAEQLITYSWKDRLVLTRTDKGLELKPEYFLNDKNLYLPYGLKPFAFDKENEGDSDAQYIRYVLDRTQATRYVHDHTYLSDFFNGKDTLSRLPQFMHFAEEANVNPPSLDSLPNMAFYRSKLNYAPNNAFNQLQYKAYLNKSNTSVDEITPVKLGHIKVITKDDGEELLNDKVQMSYAKPHVVESLALSLKERRDYMVHGLHKSPTGIYKPYYYHTSRTFDDYQVQHPLVGEKAFADLNIVLPEAEFMKTYKELFPEVSFTEHLVTGTYVSESDSKPLVEVTVEGNSHQLTVDNLQTVLSKLIKRYLSETTGWPEDDFDVEIGTDEDKEALKEAFPELAEQIETLVSQEKLKTEFFPEVNKNYEKPPANPYGPYNPYDPYGNGYGYVDYGPSPGPGFELIPGVGWIYVGDYSTVGDDE